MKNLIRILFLIYFLLIINWAYAKDQSSNDSGGLSPLLQFPHDIFYSAGQMGGISAQGVAGVLSSWGIYGGTTDTCLGSGLQSDSFGHSLTCATGSAAGSDASVDTTIGHSSDSLILNIVRFRTGSNISSLRFFAGLTDQTGSTMVGSDNPAGSYIGLQYSTDRGDVNWQFVRKDGTTQVLTNTGVAPIASRNYLLRTSTNGSTYKIEIMDQTVANVVATSTYTSGGPAATTDLRFSISIETRVAAARDFEFYYVYGVCGVEAFL